MIIRSPPSLHYPITVTRLLAEPDGTVDRFAPLFSYTYTSKVTEGNKYGDELQVEKTFPAEFQSETAGKLLSWSIKAGDVLQNPGSVAIQYSLTISHC
jgi:RNA polymerase II subunit A-like phosphatase